MTPVGRQIILNVAGTIIGVGLLVILALCLQALFTHEVPLGNKDALLVVIGMLTTKIGTIVDFFYGNSDTNKKQTETINTLAERASQQEARGSKDALNIEVGETATATATPHGTQIRKENETDSDT